MADRPEIKKDGVPTAPTVTTKKSAPPGKKKVIRRLVKNAKTGEIIKTEIVRIDSNGETTVTSYPAGTPVPSLASLQSGAKKRPSQEGPPLPPSMLPSNDDDVDDFNQHQPMPIKDEPPARADIGPSVNTALSIDELLEKERRLIEEKEKKEKQMQQENNGQEKTDPEKEVSKTANETGLEAALINLMKRKRMRDPKGRRSRGLQATTRAMRTDSDGELHGIIYSLHSLNAPVF